MSNNLCRDYMGLVRDRFKVINMWNYWICTVVDVNIHILWMCLRLERASLIGQGVRILRNRPKSVFIYACAAVGSAEVVAADAGHI
jgi:hypothetical protein